MRFFHLITVCLLVLVYPKAAFAGFEFNGTDIAHSQHQDLNIVSELNQDKQACQVSSPNAYWNNDLSSCFHYESGTTIWQGFDHSWKKTSHRLNRFGSYVRGVNFDSNYPDLGGIVSGERRYIFKVGAYNDEGTVKQRRRYIKTSALRFYHDAVSSEDLVASGKLGELKRVSHVVEVDLEELGFSADSIVTPILRGFQLKSESYDAGYNTRGFAIRLIPLEKVGSLYRFEARFFIHPEHAPDRPLASWLPLGDDCGDCDTYKYSAKVYYTLVVADAEDANFVEPQDGPTNEYSQYVKMSPGKKPSLKSYEDREVKINGYSGFEKGFVAIQGFHWHLRDWDKSKKDGRYIRQLQMHLGHQSYDRYSGDMTFTTNMYFSNQSMVPKGFDAKFMMWATLIQFNDPQYEASDSSWTSRKVSVGETAVTVPFEYGF